MVAHALLMLLELYSILVLSPHSGLPRSLLLYPTISKFARIYKIILFRGVWFRDCPPLHVFSLRLYVHCICLYFLVENHICWLNAHHFPFV